MRHIIVAGAGIGGLTAGLALSRVGFRVTICERAESLSEIGAGIQIAPNAGRVLEQLELGTAVDAAASHVDAIEVASGETGRRIASVPTSLFEERYGHRYRVFHRADLQRILADAAGRDAHVRLVTGTAVEGFVSRPDGVDVRLSGGIAGTETGAALVAADGIRSGLRSGIAPDVTARPVDRTAWRATVPADAIGDILPLDRVGLWLAPRMHLVSYPVARSTAVNVVAIVEERWHEPGWSAPADIARLDGLFSDLARPLRRLPEIPASWTRFALNTVDPAGRWTAGRAALLGDAAHAMRPFLAQGAAMAIEDAAVLAARLARDDDVPAALAAYEAERKPRVTRLAAASAGTGAVYHLGRWIAPMRDLALSVGGARLLIDRFDWIYRWRPPPLAPRARAA